MGIQWLGWIFDRKMSKENVGMILYLKFKENTEDENFDEYLEQYKIKSIIKNIQIL